MITKGLYLRRHLGDGILRAEPRPEHRNNRLWSRGARLWPELFCELVRFKLLENGAVCQAVVLTA